MTAQKKPRRTARKSTDRGPVTPALTPAALELLARDYATEPKRSNLRAGLLDALFECDALRKLDERGASLLLGRFHRAGRDLVAPLAETRHQMLHYLDRLLCGAAFVAADPDHEHVVKNDRASPLVQVLTAWRDRLDAHLRQHTELLISVQEADEAMSRARASVDEA